MKTSKKTVSQKQISISLTQEELVKLFEAQSLLDKFNKTVYGKQSDHYRARLIKSKEGIVTVRQDLLLQDEAGLNGRS